MESDNDIHAVDSAKPIEELDYELFQDPAILSQLQEHMMALQEDLEGVEESEDLEALSDEDAGYESNCISDAINNEFAGTHQSFFEEFHESQHEGQFEGAQDDHTAIFAENYHMDSDFEPDPVQDIQVECPNLVYAQEVKQREETPAVDKRAKPSQQRNASTQQPGKKNADKNDKGAKPKKYTEEALSTLHNTKTVDLLIIGGGPATLGFIINALKTGRFPELIQNDGIAILDAGTSFGGGNLCNYGINSNTSANGFLKSILRKEKKEGSSAADKLKGQSAQKAGVGKPGAKFIGAKPKPKIPQTKKSAAVEEDLHALSPKLRTPLSPKIMNSQVLNAQGADGDQALKQVIAKKVSKPWMKPIGRKPEPIKNANPIKPTAQHLLNSNAKVDQRQGGESDSNTEKRNDNYDDDIYCQAGESMELPPLTCCRELVNSSIINVMRQFGKQIVPLSLVGHLLNFVGNYVLFGAYLINRSKIFYPMHRAVNVQLMANGDIITTVQKTEFMIVKTPGKEQELTIKTGAQSLVYFRSKALIMAGGASQGFHPQIYSWFPSLLQDKSRLISSDSFLKKWVFLDTIRRLRSQQDQAGFKDGKPLKRLNIVIIGGSHSGFSCAWVLLNGPSLFQTNSLGISTANGKLPGAMRKSFKNCRFCCGCSPEESTEPAKDFSVGRPQKAPTKGREPDHAERAEKDKQCDCICKCFGYFRYDDWGVTRENLQLPIIEEAGIKILYRDNIKVFFKTGQDAINANYHDFDKERHRSKDGFVYSFTGLRGDAKNLYLTVKNGLEKRIQFVKAQTPAQQNVHVEQADIVIWACGYQSDAIPIFENGKPVKYSQTVPNTQFDVDKHCRIKLEDGSVLTKCFACGVGFPVRTKDGVAGIKGEPTNPRADSFSLYMNTVGEMLLKSILPKRKNTAMIVQRQFPQLAQELTHKLVQNGQKKKAKELLANQGANVFSQGNLQGLGRVDESRAKIMQTQKHVTHKINSQQMIQYPSSPKAVLKEQIILQVEQKQAFATDGIGDGLRYKAKTNNDPQTDEREELNMETNILAIGTLSRQQAQEDAYPKTYASKSLERQLPKHDAIELLNQFKRKHLRGLSHNRFEHLTYSDLVKRKQPSRHPVKTTDHAHNDYGITDHALQEGQTEEVDQDRFQLPDIRGRENEVRQLYRGSANTTKRRHDAYTNLIERNPSRKRQPALSGKSPQLLQKKHHEFQRQNGEKVAGPKTGQFFGRSGKHLHFGISPYIQSALDIHSQFHNSLPHRQPAQSKDAIISDPNRLQTQDPDKKSRKEARSKGGNDQGSKSLHLRSRANKRGNQDIRNVVDAKHVLAESERAKFQINGAYGETPEIQIEASALTELPPINVKSSQISQIPTIKNAIPNRKHISGSHPTTGIDLQHAQHKGRSLETVNVLEAANAAQANETKHKTEGPNGYTVDLTPSSVRLKFSSAKRAYLQPQPSHLGAASSEENLKLPAEENAPVQNLFNQKMNGASKDSKLTSVSQSQNFTQMRSLQDYNADEDRLLKLRSSPGARLLAKSTVDHDLSKLSKSSKSKKPTLNKVYAPQEILTRDQIAAIVSKSPSKPKSRPQEHKTYNEKSETKSRTICDQERPKDKTGLKSAGNLKSSTLFTPSKADPSKMEARPTEPKKSTLVSKVIAQLAVSQLVTNDEAQRKIL